MTAKIAHHIAVVRLIDNARDMEDSVLEDFDRDFLFASVSITPRQHDNRNAVVTETSRAFRRGCHYPMANLVLPRCSALDYALLFDLDDSVGQRQVVR